MARTNVPRKLDPRLTHEGSTASHINHDQQLQRSVLACLLWENEFYEDGMTISERIKCLIPLVKPERVMDIALQARSDMNLRHVPLLLVREMARLETHKHLVADLLESVIQRADELAEFLAIYWKDGKQPLSAQVKKGLARAFLKFNEYQLAKYNRDNAVKLRDVLFLCHAHALTDEQQLLFKKLANNELATPDTWEVELSAGNVSKRESWERLLRDRKLGGLALIRNLRNMKKCGVDESLIRHNLNEMNTSRILPFRFMSAAIHAPEWEPELEDAMMRSIQGEPKVPGKTVIIVDVSGSMYGASLSSRSDMDRAKAACSMAAIAREMFMNPVIFATAGDDYRRVHATQRVPSRHGFALVDAIHKLCQPLGGGGIFLKQVMDYVLGEVGEVERVLVITDEQDCDRPGAGSPDKAAIIGKHNYIINVGSNENGIAYGRWTHITGWSDAVLRYIVASERN